MDPRAACQRDGGNSSVRRPSGRAMRNRIGECRDNIATNPKRWRPSRSALTLERQPDSVLRLSLNNAGMWRPVVQEQ
jgi:hypothetical protein